MADPFPHNQPFPPFIELLSVDSTNNYARGLVHAGMAQHGTAVFTHEQTAGRGQKGRIWEAGQNMDILLTLILKPLPGQVWQAFKMSAGIALATADFFSKYAGDETKIKWPNDIYWQDRKAGGILIENIVSQPLPVNGGNFPVNENRDWTLAGIGININQVKFPENLSNPVSLKQITGKNFDPLELARELAALATARFDTLDAANDLHERYNQLLYKKGQQVKLKKGNRVFEARIDGVSADGQLQVFTSIPESLDSGEVEWQLQP